MSYRHIVVFRLYDHLEEADVDRAVAALESLDDLPGLLEWTVRRSDDTRKGRMVVENALFEDREAFESFRVHPRHTAVSGVLRELADWWIGDYEEPSRG